jgi:DNA-binding transcriptional regulator YdaS (Cro superfamily)
MTNQTAPDVAIVDPNPVQIAIDLCGSQKALGDHCGVAQAAVSQWVRGLTAIDVRHYETIERVTDGKVTREHLLQFEIDRLNNKAPRKAS